MLEKYFKYYPNKIAIIDRGGSVLYSELEQLTHLYKIDLQKNGILNKRVIVKAKNDRYLIALISALLQNNNEVILQEPQSSSDETKKVIELYHISYLLAANEKGINYQVLSDNFAGNILESKLYYFSSGSVGVPKIFGFTLDKLENLLNTWINYIHLETKDISLCPLSITHFHGSIVSFSALMQGNTLIFLSDASLQMEELSTLLVKYSPTIITGVPHLYQKLLTHLPSNFKGFKQIKYAICGSAPLSTTIAQKMYDQFGIYLYQGYGLSEIGAICMDLEPQKGLGTVGKVIPEIDYKIINEDGEKVNKGEEGELIVKADYMTDGYLMQAELTNECFINGWLHTKDIVKEDAFNRLIILGRKSSFINISGFKVHPVEIEKTIVAYDDSILVAVKEKIDNGKTTIVAYLENADHININDLKSYCSERLAHYKIPAEFILVNELPKNTIGKVRYNQIQA